VVEEKDTHEMEVREGAGSQQQQQQQQQQDELYPLPPLTTSNGPRPTYFTCRHTYENTLIDEIKRFASSSTSYSVDGSLDTPREITATAPYPGLVRVEDNHNILPSLYDPAYALQIIPSCVVISAESINGIAREVVSALLDDEDDTRSVQLKEQLYNVAQRGALTVHPLVPGMCKGQSKPIMQHRVHKVCEEISKMLKKTFIAARRKASSVAAAAAADVDNKEDGNITQQNNNERYVLQIMLQSSNIAVARTW
jgi:hypothetical protein